MCENVLIHSPRDAKVTGTKKKQFFRTWFSHSLFVNFRVKKVSMEAWVSGSFRKEICEQLRKFVTLVSCICFCSNSSILLFLRCASLSSNICRWRNLFRVRLIRKEKGEKNNNKKRSIITCVNWHARGVGKILAHTWQGLKRTLSDCQNYEKCDTKTKTFDMKLLWGDNS